jgi:hypothetical protein
LRASAARSASKKAAYIGSEICGLALMIDQITFLDEKIYSELFDDPCNKAELGIILHIWDNISKKVKANAPLKHVDINHAIYKIYRSFEPSM